MNEYLDIGRWKAMYGVRAEQLAKDIPLNNKREQQTDLGAKLYSQHANGTYEFMPVTLGGIKLWAPIIRLTGRKTVVETQLIERKGSVKEIINTDDFIINIKGIIKRVDGKWPDDELEMLRELYTRNEAVKIESALTSRMMNGNEYVVITNLQLPENPGFVESISYELECVEDVPFELELDENGN